MEFPGAVWREAPPEEAGVDPDALGRALEHWRSATGEHGVDRVVIARRGVVLHKGPDAAVENHVWSCTKSFTSTALGLLSHEKGIPLDTPAVRFEPLLADLYPTVTLRHFATMTSGYNAPGGSRWGEPSEDWSPTPYVPAPAHFAPGEQFRYWDEAQMMFGRVLTRIVGADLLDFLQGRVMDPIGGRIAAWAVEGEIDGIPIRNGCTGLRLTALDLARFGHLFLNDGRWADKQIVPAEWMREATRPQIAPTTLPGAGERGADGRGRYGFNWWVNGRRPDGRLAMPDSPEGVYYAAGLNHNICLVVPPWEMVLVRVGEDRQPDRSPGAILNDLLRLLAPGIRPIGGT